MSLSFASLSVHGFVTSVGAYVGLGSLLAVALLVILYFAHARETATLRERLDEAQQRISGLESRIAQLMQMQASQRGRGPVAPAPAPATVAPPVAVRAPGAPQGSVRRVPNPATAAAGAAAPVAALGAVPSPARTTAAPPSAPAGVAGPALASATRMIPDATGTGASDDTMFVPAAAAANGKPGEHTAVLAAAPAAPSAVAAASARVASASPRVAVAPPPRVQIGEDQHEHADAPATAAGSRRVRRIGGNPQSPTVSLPAFDDQSVGGGRFSGALLPVIIAGVAVIVIIAGLIVITNSGGGTTTGNVNHHNGSNAGATGQTLHNKKPVATPFSAASYKVAVLNGTAQAGLAGDVGNKLIADGYKKGNITNAASQTEGLTLVYYVKSNANKIAAEHVAKALTLPASRVHKAGPSVIQSCKISPTGASLGSCTAQVIVSVGQDRVTLATG
jgi:hypothetical protein